MGRNFFHVYLIVVTCRIFILFLYKVQNKCLGYINCTRSTNITEVSPEDQLVYDTVCKRINNFLINEKHFQDKNINIVEMAHQCHIRKDLVNKTLKAKYDLTFSNYLREKRIKYACTLLLDPSNMKIDVISDASGFKTTRTFVRSFRSVKNVSPTEYRHLQVFKRNMFC